MAEIDNTIALGVKPQPQQDIIGPISSLAQLQYLQAHGALEGAQAQFQQGKIRALSQYGEMVNNGAAPEDAITKSSLGAYDPSGANAMLGNIGTARGLKSNEAYSKSGNPGDLAIQGPEAVSKGVTAGVDRQAYEQGLQLAKQHGELITQKLGIAGQIASGVLAMGDVNGQPPPGGIPPAVRQDAVNKAIQAGLITKEQAAQEAQMSDGDFWNTAKSWAGMAQGAKDAAETSGRAEANKTAGKAQNEPHVREPGQIPYTVGNTPAGGAASPNYFGSVSQHESGNNPSAVNPNGGAAGLYQFMPGTWRNLMQTHPELGLTPGGATDPGQAQKAMAAFTSDNAGVLAKAGVPVTDKNLFMAHFLGAGGAVKFMQAAQANPNAPAAEAFPAEAKQNSTIFYAGSRPRSLGEVYGMMTSRFGNGMTASGTASLAGMGASQGGMVLPQAAGGPAPAAAGPGPIAPPAAVIPPNGGQPNQPDRNPLAPAPPAQLGVAPITPAGTGLTITDLAPAMSLQDIAAAKETGSGMAKAQVDQFAKAKGDFDAANTAQMKLGELMTSLDDMPKSGLLTPGSGATERVGFAKLINTALQAAGSKPMFPPDQIASAENSQKITGNLGFDLSRTLGSKEAASITEQAIKLNPGIENTPLGARVVAGAINAGLQRQRDFYQFLSENKSAPDADLKFNKAHPPAQYVKEAQSVARVPSQAIKMLQENPALADKFDATYGSGLSRYFTGS